MQQLPPSRNDPLPDPSSVPAQQFSEGIKWFAGMSTLMVASSPTIFLNVGFMSKRFLFGGVLFQVCSMMFAGLAFFLNAHHYYSTTDHQCPAIPSAEVTARRLRLTLIWQFVCLLLGAVCEIISLWGFVAGKL
jgi:hypothetical protein